MSANRVTGQHWYALQNDRGCYLTHDRDGNYGPIVAQGGRDRLAAYRDYHPWIDRDRLYHAVRVTKSVLLREARRCEWTALWPVGEDCPATVELSSRDAVPIRVRTYTPRAYAVEYGALVECPNHNGHGRARNWLAVIRPDPSSPGGLRREFQPRGRGRYYYLVGALRAGQAVEIGADYYTGGGKKQPHRWYGAVLAVSDKAVRLQRCADATVAREVAAVAARRAARK